MPRLSDLLPRDEASAMRPTTSRSQLFGLPQVTLFFFVYTYIYNFVCILSILFSGAFCFFTNMVDADNCWGHVVKTVRVAPVRVETHFAPTIFVMFQVQLICAALHIHVISFYIIRYHAIHARYWHFHTFSSSARTSPWSWAQLEALSMELSLFERVERKAHAWSSWGSLGHA